MDQKTPPPELSGAETRRYGRHLSLPEFGLQGQRALKNSSVLLVGAGGLGSPLGLYLAAAGVGTIGIVDGDRVDESNLQRQVLYTSEDIGQLKAETAASRLRALNPEIEILPYTSMLTTDNALDIISRFDLVIDGSDNFATRYLVNDACVMSGKPNIYGSVLRFDGQASVFNFNGGPCYRCLFPEPPPPELSPSCSEAGVLGVLPGLIACIQATEAIKLLTGIGKSLSGRLLVYDALTMRFETMQMRRDPDCAICGDNPSITELVDYGVLCADTALANVEELQPEDLHKLLQKQPTPLLIDVREPHELEICVIGDSLAIPLGSLEARLQELPRDRSLVCYCKSGERSRRACGQLQAAGFEKVCNLSGGILAWAEQIDPTLNTY